ncbi:MAG: glycoside hydrolase family protein, partial [Spirochaetia bacterium]|nr:glycoside hydrolase family protein [Spirochaetia bacterium]
SDEPILSPRKSFWDASVVTNPAPCIDEDGGILLYYRSNTPSGLRIGLARADNNHSEFKRVVDEPVFSASNNLGIEDPFVWKTAGGFSMIAKDMSGEISGEKHGGIMAHSLNGVDWTVSDPPKAYSRQVRWTDGRTTLQGCLERPQILFENGEATHLFAATGDGTGGFDKVTRTWNMVLPLA